MTGRPGAYEARAIVDAIFETAFPRGVPSHVARIVDRDAAAAALEGFKLNPVLSLDGRPHRVATSDVGELRTAWTERIAEICGPMPVQEFFDRYPAARRRMVDTDGQRVVVYADDFADEGSGELQVMCCSLSNDGERTTVIRDAELPLRRLPGDIARTASALGLSGGFWAARWRQGQIVGALWISESRWRGDAERTGAHFDRIAGGSWRALREVADARGHIAYPDGVEIVGAGAIDVTVGFVRRRRGS